MVGPCLLYHCYCDFYWITPHSKLQTEYSPLPLRANKVGWQPQSTTTILQPLNFFFFIYISELTLLTQQWYISEITSLFRGTLSWVCWSVCLSCPFSLVFWASISFIWGISVPSKQYMPGINNMAFIKCIIYYMCIMCSCLIIPVVKVWYM